MITRGHPARIALVGIVGLTVVALAGAAHADRRMPMPPAPIALPPIEGHLSSKARAINARGEIAGFSFDGRTIATVWDRHGRSWPLAPLEGDSGSEGFAISDWGEVAGDSIGAVRSAVRWTAQGPMRLAPPEGDLESFARGINNRGEVAGFSAMRNHAGSDNGVLLQAVRWSADGEPTVLPPLDEDIEAIALAINDRGIVVGYSFSPGGREAAVGWDRAGVPHALLPLPDGQDAVAHAISGKGTAVGDSGEKPALWSARIEPRALPLLPADSTGHGLAVNQRDAAVGVSISRELVHSAVLWRRGAPPVRLPALPGHQESFARGINARGDIVGFSVGETGFTAVLWPVSP